jgi:hypothetical protein
VVHFHRRQLARGVLPAAFAYVAAAVAFGAFATRDQACLLVSDNAFDTNMKQICACRNADHDMVHRQLCSCTLNVRSSVANLDALLSDWRMLTHINCCLYRQHDHALALYPLPHLLVIADAGGPMATAQFADCQCLNPVRRQLADTALYTISCFVQATLSCSQLPNVGCGTSLAGLLLSQRHICKLCACHKRDAGMRPA